MGRTLWELLQEKQRRPHPLFKMNPPLIFQNVRCARGFEAMRSLYPVIMLAGERKKRGGGRDWELWPKKRDFIKRRGRKEKAAPAAAGSVRFSTAEQRQKSTVVDVKWLNRPGRGRKVQKRYFYSSPRHYPSLCTPLGPLLNFPGCPSPWQKLK